MKYLLDTNVLVGILNADERLLTQLSQNNESDFAISSVVLFELYYGAYKSQRTDQNLAKIKLLPFDILQFNQNDADIAGKIRADLERKGTPIGAYDTLIAGQALARGLTLITHNVREFERVPNLKLADWLA